MWTWLPIIGIFKRYLVKKIQFFGWKNLYVRYTMCSLRNVFALVICMTSAYVQDFYVRSSCAKVLGIAHTLCNDEIFPDSFLRCRLLSGAISAAYSTLYIYLRTIRNRLLPPLSNRNCCIGEIHVIMHARSEKYHSVYLSLVKSIYI